MVVRPASAAAVDFRPVLTFGVFHAGNVQIIGEEPDGDESAAIVLDLAIDRMTESSGLSFYYQGAYIAYRQSSALDYLGNLLGVSYTKDFSLRTGLRASVDVSRTDSQGVAGSTVAPTGAGTSNVGRPLTFVPRTTITRGYGSASGTVDAGKRSLADWEFHATIARFDEVPGVTFNNSDSASASGGWRYELNPRTTLGLRAGVGWFGFEQTADSVGGSLVLTGTYALSPLTTMAFDLGATHTTTGDVSTTTGTFLLSFLRELTANASLTAAVEQLVTPGTGLQAATNDAGAWVSYTQSSVRNGLIWAINGAYWLRRTLPAGNGPTFDTRTLNLAGALGWRFNRFLELSAGYSNFYQRIPDDASSQLNTSYASYGLFLRWAFRGLTGAPGLGGRFPQGP